MTSIIFFANSVIANDVKTPVTSANSDTKIQLEGFFNFQSGYSSQNKLIGSDKYVSDNRKKLAFYSDAAFFATVSQDFNDVIAGAKIVLVPTTKASGALTRNGSHIFLKTEYGKVEAGSPYDAGAKMRITGSDITAATVTNWNKYAPLGGLGMQYRGVAPDFDIEESFFIESSTDKYNPVGKTEPARKVSYYTPKMQGFQFGISYIPDTGNTGGGSINNLKDGVSTTATAINNYNIQNPNGNSVTKTITVNQNVKDAISAAVSYEHELTDEAALKLAVTGEYGKPARGVTETDTTTKQSVQYKLSDLKAYNLGAVVTYGNFAASASYGTLGKSLTAKEYHKVGRDTRYYNSAIAYGQGPIKTSVSYFKSIQYKNTLNTVTLGTEYKLTPGVLPYAAISFFQAKGKPVYYPEALNTKTKGTVALIGAKLKF